MSAALVVILVIAVGLPLVAWWIGGRRFWGGLRPGSETDPWGDLVRRHSLSAAEVARVATAVPRGRPLADPRLRPAAAELAAELLEQQRPGGSCAGD